MVRMAKEDDNKAMIGDMFEALIAKGSIQFHEAELEDLPSEWAKTLVKDFLIKHNIKWMLGDVKLAGAVCIKTNDPFLQYLDIFRSEFMWATKNHHEGVHPDVALMHMLNKIGEIKG